MALSKCGLRFAQVLAASVFVLAAAFLPALAALTPEQATRVGGGLSEAQTRLVTLQEAALKTVAAVPETWPALAAAVQRISQSSGSGGIAGLLSRPAFALVLIALLVIVYRRGLQRARRSIDADPQPARAAAWLLAMDAGDRAIVAVAAFAWAETVFSSGSLHDLFALALLWTVVRWRVAMWLVEALLRPSRPAFRLIAMSDAAARQVKAIVGVTILVGFAGISVMPVLLRAGLPIPAGQVLALVQGILVAVGCAAALWRYRVSHSAPPKSARRWTILAASAIALLWVFWSVSVLLLEFTGYHAFTWSLRIGALAYLAHALLGLSSSARWVVLLQRSITAAAVIAIAILLAEVWLVEQLGLIAPQAWAQMRGSLVAAGATVCAGYVSWRWLYYWTEGRLHASLPDDAGTAVQAASRLNTVLPMLRVLAGGTILVVTVLLALSQLGVEITPLLAGAGVVGLAISFGAQTLVKDIITGAFFLVDDAFRVGEYIISDSYKGRVEAITLRAVKLRHHRGPLYTVPFGEVRAVQNMSRDWVIDKFVVGITYDSDIEKARKLIKQIGQTLAADPELAPHFIEPLKMQGVEQFGDFAVQLRIKMKTRPGEQFVIRRKAYTMLKKAFDENGIRFAFPTVQVAGGAGGGAATAAAAHQSLANAKPPPAAP